MGARTVNKRLCVLQVAPENPSEKHLNIFSNKENCDFYFVTHDKQNDLAMKFCPNTTWTDTRNILAAEVPKNYDYYAFVDYDYIFKPLGERGVLEQILHDLHIFNPAVLTYYPGSGMTTPFAKDIKYRESKEYSVLPFSHCGLKIVHHSLLNWFFPMITRFGGGVEACHLFNILEIPFMRNVVCSHKMIYDNGVTDYDAPHNQDGSWNDYRMNEMWKWIKPAFYKSSFVDSHASSELQKSNSLLVKNVFQSIFVNRNIEPIKSEKIDSYLDLEKIGKFFDISHERFINMNSEMGSQLQDLSEENIEKIKSVLYEVTFKDLKKQKNPWQKIAININKKIKEGRRPKESEIIDIYQKLNSDSIFYKSCSKNQELEKYLKDKTVAFVGPAPYLKNLGKGSLIDSYDIVVRIQHGIENKEDYGSRSDIIQSCLNSNYGPPLVSHLQNLDQMQRPKFIICNDTASQLKRDGSWAFVDEVYEPIFKNLNIPFVHLKNSDGTWDRWALYWEIYAKEHIEKFKKGSYTVYSANFNSGYGALNVLLSYPIKKLAVFGVDFYNGGVPQTDAEKYTKQYTDTYGVSGTPNGPDKVLHDQVSQMMHCKNVLLRDPRFILDEPVLKMLMKDDIISRINNFKLLPKFKVETR
jgi:hypothetical protein